MNVLITGGTGLIGKEIGKSLVAKGHQVTVLSRNRAKALQECPFPCKVIQGDLGEKPLSESEIQSIDAVIHLMGENVGDGRWTAERKKSILESRKKSSENLIKSFSSQSQLKVMISASGIGFYGDRADETLDESSAKGTGFLSDVCKAWEEPFQSQSKYRTVQIRIGLVLSAFGGALPKMITPFQLGLGGTLGSGHQWQSWIHIEDLVRVFLLALEQEKLQGPVNAVSPYSLPQTEFAQKLAHALQVRLGPKAPAVALKALLGEMSSLVLDSQKVVPRKLQDLNFSYLYSEIGPALAETCSLYQGGHSLFFAQQYFPEKRENLFSFFSDAKNLEKITPSFLNFKIQSMSTPEVQKGTLIDYRLKVHGIPVGWRTLIDTWEPPRRFVDIQLKGPYKVWHHTHEFSDLSSGTLMKDIVRYKLPAGPLGAAVGGLFVEKDIKKIFAFRRQILSKDSN